MYPQPGIFSDEAYNQICFEQLGVKKQYNYSMDSLNNNSKKTRKRIAYSQNFLRSKDLVTNLIRHSSISKDDAVYEIGAGQGVITENLSEICKKVIAFEIDQNLASKLTSRFQNKPVEIKQGDFLSYPLPQTAYKVFSNIPFNITADVIKKLTQSNNPPEDAYLIVQKEAANKFVGKPHDSKNSQMAILLKPWFDLEIIHHFKRTDFFPTPSVDTVLLRVKKKAQPSITPEQKRQYEDFVVFTFNQFKPNVVEGLAQIFGRGTLLKLSRDLNFPSNAKPSELEFQAWVQLFNFFSKQIDTKNKARVVGSANRLFKLQKGLEKVHRTRTDKDWKKYS